MTSYTAMTLYKSKVLNEEPWLINTREKITVLLLWSETDTANKRHKRLLSYIRRTKYLQRRMYRPNLSKKTGYWMDLHREYIFTDNEVRNILSAQKYRANSKGLYGYARQIASKIKKGEIKRGVKVRKRRGK